MYPYNIIMTNNLNEIIKWCDDQFKSYVEIRYDYKPIHIWGCGRFYFMNEEDFIFFKMTWL